MDARVNLTVDDSHLGRFDDVVKAVQNAGLKVESKLSVIGVMTGYISEARLPSLVRVPGVGHVEREGSVSVPAPGVPIQ